VTDFSRLYSIKLYDNIARVYLILSDFIKMKNLFTTLSCLMILLTACVPAGRPLASQNGIEIYQASIRLSGGDMPAAGYLLIKNTSAINDRLVNVQADFAEESMLHQSVVDSNGVASMNMLTAIDVPAGQMVELKPGSFHIVFLGLKPGLKAGNTVTLLLQFQRAGAISVQAQLTNP
jgi:copper(I)-binding protein